MVIPEPKEVQILLGFRGLLDWPLTDEFLEGLEETLDPPVLPRREGRRALMPNAEQEEPEAEESRGEDRLVVGADASGLAEELDRIQDRAKDRDRGLAPQITQCQTGTGTVIEEAEDGSLAATLADVGQVERPNDIRWHRLGFLVLELAADRSQLVLALPQHGGDEGLADGHVSPMLVQVVEDDRYLSTSVQRHQGFEAQDFLVDPWWLGRGTRACRRRRCLGPSPDRRRWIIRSSPEPEGEQGHEADQEKQKLGLWGAELHGRFLPGTPIPGTTVFERKES